MATPEHVVVNGFTLVPVKFNEKSSAGHVLYIKEHSVRDSDPCKPRDRTLFILNVPPYCNEQCLERLFSDCGSVDRIYLQKKPTSAGPATEESQIFKTVPAVTGFKVAYIVFKTASAVKKAKQMPYGEPHVLSTPEHPVLTGIKKWTTEYGSDVPDVSSMQEEINKWLAAYDQKVKEEEEQAKEQEGQADEDGWVTVTKHSRNKGIPRSEAAEAKVMTKEKKKRAQKELLNFYTFQIRESKREHIANLRQKFEEDKQRIALMKAARKFRPF